MNVHTSSNKATSYEPRLFGSVREVQRFARNMLKSSDAAERERGKRVAQLAERAIRRGGAAEAQLLELLNSHGLTPADLDGGVYRTRLTAGGE